MYIVEVAVSILSAGIAAGDHGWGMTMNWDGSGTGATQVAFDAQGTTLTSPLIRYEQDGTGARASISYPGLALDTFYTIRAVTSGRNLAIYVNNVFQFSGANAPGDSDGSFIGLYMAGTATVQYKDLKFWRVALPED